MTCTRRLALATPAALCTGLAAEASAGTGPAADGAARQAIEAYARAWQQGDMPALLACYHDRFTLNYFGRNGLAGRHRGKAAALKVLGELRQRTRRQLKSVDALLAGGDLAVMLTRETLVADAGPVEIERLYRYTVSDGRLLECWVYDQDQRLLDELIGAQPPSA